MHTFREATLADVDATFSVRGMTRQNPISRQRLEQLGITPSSVADAMRAGAYGSWVCEADGAIVGFCNADAGTGEVIVLAVLPAHEGQGVGKTLLSRAVAYLQARALRRIWLTTSPSADFRSHGFYRANGWSPSGRMQPNGDEELFHAATSAS